MDADVVFAAPLFTLEWAKALWPRFYRGMHNVNLGLPADLGSDGDPIDLGDEDDSDANVTPTPEPENDTKGKRKRSYSSGGYEYGSDDLPDLKDGFKKPLGGKRIKRICHDLTIQEAIPISRAQLLSRAR
jgi:hypothetical protein